LNNNTAEGREGEDANRTRVAGHLDEIHGVVANMLKLHRNGAVGFIGSLGLFVRLYESRFRPLSLLRGYKSSR